MIKDEVVVDLIRAVAALVREDTAGWSTYRDAETQIQKGIVGFGNDRRYTLLRDDSGQILVFTPPEWDAFRGGNRKGEFDEDAGLCPASGK